MLADAFIFDMDGTLWDAVDSYTRIWNATLEQCGEVRPPVTRDELIALMGRHLEDILHILLPGKEVTPELMRTLESNDRSMMPLQGGILYPGVRETLEELARRVPLFMVSNCGPEGLKDFMRFNRLEHVFTDTLSHGQTGLPKEENIIALIKRYNLDNAYYVGDTVTDERAARAAGVGMVWCSYGFGTAEAPDYTIRRPSDLLGLPITPAATK